MDAALGWEFKALINELTQGVECTKRLRASFNSETSFETQNSLLQQIVASYEKSLMILNCGSGRQTQQVPPLSSAPESSISVDGSPRSDEMNKGSKDQEYRDMSKKRKLMPTWTEQVKVGTDNGLEGPPEDGYSWRKYGQKDILGAKYPRSYYRCTYRAMQNCWATKQVQRSDEDPTTFEITYKGAHTCSQAPKSVPPLASPKKQDLKQSIHCKDSLSMQPNQMLMELRSNLKVNTSDLERKETTYPFSFPPTFSGLTDEKPMFQISQVDDNLLGTYSPSFVSPTTPESNYFSVSHQQTSSFGGVQNLHHSESDLTDIFSANTSSTNSPIVGLDYTLDPADFDPNFLFDTSEFFT
ncbi:probable WRKY transcription factor 53 [Ipomoea triloba]|uniref:probable WRKY transcription factor 53 n=1 Tax=Ipomoea triloba TaxID=35885 RepID=UPI00125D8756|nr:probable WRKY transcription factor 53 [Ipomoea triloba]